MALEIDLKGHTALITGASGELGRVMVRTLAACGADIAIHYYKNRKKAEALQSEVEEKGYRACIVSGDVGSFEAISLIQKNIRDALGDPDIIVANAVSQILPWKPLLKEEIEDYEDQFRTCVLHNVFLAKVFIPAMIKKKWGRYIGINTECAMQTDITQSAYASAKRGMDGVLRVLAKEIGEHRITVNQVAPGWTVSDKDRKKRIVVQKKYQSTVPLRRRGTDQEIANVVAFLASDLASFITGAYIPVCGGNVMPAI
jgi:3-oxoacyl-[acyl-carrier protein] reductase